MKTIRASLTGFNSNTVIPSWRDGHISFGRNSEFFQKPPPFDRIVRNEFNNDVDPCVGILPQANERFIRDGNSKVVKRLPFHDRSEGKLNPAVGYWTINVTF